MPTAYLERLSNENLIGCLQSAMKTQPLLEVKRQEGLEYMRALQNEMIRRFQNIQPESV